MVTKRAGGSLDAKWSAEADLSLFHWRDEINPYRGNGGYLKPATILPPDTILPSLYKEVIGS